MCLQDTTGGLKAVMVWFHGGAYVAGFNNQYPGHFLAANDIIIVVPNYRMDAFGEYLSNLTIELTIISLVDGFRLYKKGIGIKVLYFRCCYPSSRQLFNSISRTVLNLWKVDNS